MAIPTAVSSRPCRLPLPTRGTGWLRGGLLAAVLGHDAEPPFVSARGAEAPRESPAFIDLFSRYHSSLIDYLYGMTRDRELAADLAQDTFVRAFTAAPELVGIAQPRAWLYRIATHVALNANRHRRHFDWLPLSRIGSPGEEEVAGAWSALPPLELPQGPGDLAADVAERDAVWTVLTELPPRWRAVLLLQTTAGLEVPEIAALLHLSEANVRKVLFRAKERFRTLYRQLDERGGE